MGEKFYHIKHLVDLHPDAHYYVVYGKRSNGKTYSTLNEVVLTDYFANGAKFAYIRRWKEDIKVKNMTQLFAGIANNGVIKKLSKNKWDDVIYNNRAFYLCKHKEDGTKIVDEYPFGFVFVLSEEEHDKGFEIPEIKNIVFDEFIARNMYLPDEFIAFTNVLSTIIRTRDGIRIFMLGNTINRFCPYFGEMGLSNIKNQQIGTIDVYRYGDSGLKVVCEYSDAPEKKSKSDVYFAFNNPKLQMITKGSWEIAVYPHLTEEMRYLPKHVKYMYFIDFDDILLQCNIVKKDNMLFTYIHRKTTPIKPDNKYLVYSLRSNPKPNYRRNFTSSFTYVEKLIVEMFKKDKVFYQSNDIGDVVRNFINVSRSNM